METKREKDYGYEYPLKAIRFGEIELDVREMRKDEMLDSEYMNTFYCDIDGTIYQKGESDFELLEEAPVSE
jgi:hypothetical protein